MVFSKNVIFVQGQGGRWIARRRGSATSHKQIPKANAEIAQKARFYLFIRLAAYAAPNPLSIFTTVTPAAQELSMPSRAAIPPNEAP